MPSFFYKNVIWTIAMFWYLIYTSFDATYLFEYTLLLMYNLFFTSLPVAVMGVFDQDTNAQASLAFPQLYKPGIVGREYTRTRFWLYMADGLYQSAIVFFIPFLAYGAGETWSHTGHDTGDLAVFGTTVACAGVIAANAYVGVNSRYWTVITWVIIVASTALCFIWIPIYSALSNSDFDGVASRTFTTFTFWATVLLTVALCIGPRWFVKAFKSSYMPRDKDIIREAWVAGTLKDDLGLQHRSKRKQKRSDKRREHNDEELGNDDGGIILDDSPEFGDIAKFTDRGEYAQTAQTPSRRSAQGYTYPPSPYIDSPTPSGASTPTRPPRPTSLALDPFSKAQVQMQSQGFGQDVPPVRPQYSRNGSEGSGSVTTPLNGPGALISPTSTSHSIPLVQRASSSSSVPIHGTGSYPQSPREMGMGQRKLSSRRGSRDQGSSAWASVPSPRRVNSGASASANQGYGQSYAAEGDGFEMVSPPTSHQGLSREHEVTSNSGSARGQGDEWEQLDFSKSRGDLGQTF
jgi:phospholipid-translocating ATPase